MSMHLSETDLPEKTHGAADAQTAPQQNQSTLTFIHILTFVPLNIITIQSMKQRNMLQ